MIRNPIWCFPVGLCLAAVLAVGCGGEEELTYTTLLKGQVTQAGQPIQFGGDTEYGSYAFVEVQLIAVEGDAKFTAQAAQDGSFEIGAPEGQTIADGQYKIAVYAWNPAPDTDMLDGKFDEENTPIVRDVLAGQDLVIDLDTP